MIATYAFALFIVSGMTGQIGRPAVIPAERAAKDEAVRWAWNLIMVALLAQGTLSNREAAQTDPALSTVPGRIGPSGLLARLPVVKGSTPAPAALAYSQITVASRAKTVQQRPRSAQTSQFVLSTASGILGLSGRIAPRAVARESPRGHVSGNSMQVVEVTCAGALTKISRPASRTHVRLTVLLVTGHIGDPAAKHVAMMVCTYALVVSNPKLSLVASHVMLRATVPSRVSLDLAQWTACGMTGRPGPIAQRAAMVV